MIKEYITEHNGNFNCHKFTLSSGTEVILSEEEQEELLGSLYHLKVDNVLIANVKLKKEVENYEDMAKSLYKFISIGESLL